MGIQCESCGEITEDENSIFCKYCGFRYEKTEFDALKNIEIILKENQRDSRNQTRILVISLIVSVWAYLIAFVALLVYVFTQPVIEERYVGLGMIFFVVVLIWFVSWKFKIPPIDLDEIK
jgi:uncharacterized membrane protein YvbJ